jgi:hypothetical protein
MYSGSSALHSASGRGLLPLVRTLVRSGADSGLKNCHNDTPLMVARSHRVSARSWGACAHWWGRGPGEGAWPRQGRAHANHTFCRFLAGEVQGCREPCAWRRAGERRGGLRHKERGEDDGGVNMFEVLYMRI